MFESDADRLAMVQAVGEQLDTGKPTKLWAIFDREFLEQHLGEYAVEEAGPAALCRSSDVAAHELVKDSRVTRADGTGYFCRRFEPDGTGMTLVRLKA